MSRFPDMECRPRPQAWPDGIVTVTFAKSYSKRETILLKRAMTDFMDSLKIDTPQGPRYPIFFRVWEGKSPEPPYVCKIGKTVQDSHADVGMYGKSCMRLRENWMYDIHSFRHEAMHVLGFFHEHQRIDRDEHVKVVAPSDVSFDIWKTNFAKIPPHCFMNPDLMKLPYDIKSILHYDLAGMACVKPGTELCRSHSLSPTDIQKVQLVYKNRYTLNQVKELGGVYLEGPPYFEEGHLPRHLVLFSLYDHYLGSSMPTLTPWLGYVATAEVVPTPCAGSPYPAGAYKMTVSVPQPVVAQEGHSSIPRTQPSSPSQTGHGTGFLPGTPRDQMFSTAIDMGLSSDLLLHLSANRSSLQPPPLHFPWSLHNSYEQSQQNSSFQPDHGSTLVSQHIGHLQKELSGVRLSCYKRWALQKRPVRTSPY